MLREIKKIAFASVLVVAASLTNALAFDLEDYATTFRQTRDAHDHYNGAFARLQQAEAKYRGAFQARMEMEKAVRNKEKENALDKDPVDEGLVSNAENELNKLQSLEILSHSCGL